MFVNSRALKVLIFERALNTDVLMFSKFCDLS